MWHQEPERLASGKRFHTLAQSFYSHDSSFVREQGLYKVGGRHGRADIFLLVESSQAFAAIAEAKNSDWEAFARRGTLRRNVTRQAAQLWSYLDGVVELVDEDVVREVSLAQIDRFAAMVFPRAPHASVRTEVDDAFGEYGISVVRLNEPPPEDSEAFAAWAAVLRISPLLAD